MQARCGNDNWRSDRDDINSNRCNNDTTTYWTSSRMRDLIMIIIAQCY